MGLSINKRQAYSEINEFLGMLSDEQINKVPRKLRDLFAKESDKAYVKKIDPSVPIEDQNLKKETLALIAFLNLKYWCEDENEKQRLIQVYEKNEKLYQELLQVQFDPDEVFKKKEIIKESKQEKVENVQIQEYKQSTIKRIWNRILVFLHLK